jgi:Na+-driven multidrug efflux pump
MTIVSPWIYEIWLGDRIKIPFLVTLSMSFFSIINVFLAPYTNFINGIGKMKLSTYLVLVTFIVYVPLAVFLAKLLGSSAGIMFATCLLNVTGLYFQPLQIKKILNNNAQGIWNE